MSSNLINLLPQEYARELRRNYLMRLGVLFILGLAAVVVVNAVLLVPSFLYVKQQIQTDMRSLDQFTHTYATEEEKQVNDELAALAQESSYLATLSNTPTASGTIRSILAVPHPGIVLTQFAFNAPTKSSASTLQIQGVASTREALSAYAAALRAVPFVKDDNLPISAYAQATNLSFTDTLVLSFPTK